MTAAPDPGLAERWLVAERERLQAAGAQLRSEREEEQASRAEELSSLDQHPGETATETETEERDQSIATSLAAELEEVEDALARLRAGTYGRCEVDGEPIPEERLAVLPAARRCARHQAALERGGA